MKGAQFCQYGFINGALAFLDGFQRGEGIELGMESRLSLSA